MGNHVPGNLVDLQTMGTCWKKYISDTIASSGPQKSGIMLRHPSMHDASDGFMAGETSEQSEGVITLTTLGIQESQDPYDDLVYFQDGNYLADFDGQFGSPSNCLPPQNLSLSIPSKGEDYPIDCLQTSLGGPFVTSDSTWMAPVYSANSEKESLSPFSLGGSTFNERLSPSSSFSFSFNTGFHSGHEPSQTTPLSACPETPSEFYQSYTEYAKGEVSVYNTGHGNCSMSVYPTGMEICSPISCEPTDGGEQFNGQPLSYSPSAHEFVPQNPPIEQFRSNMHESECPMGVVSSQPAEYPSAMSDESDQDIIGNGLTDLVNGIGTNEIPRPGPNSQTPCCIECGWYPADTGKRTPQKMRQAVQKHYKRNHQSQVYNCEFCPTKIRNRRDNMKDHVRKKHPVEFLRKYPGSQMKRRHSLSLPYVTPAMARKGSMGANQGYTGTGSSPWGRRGSQVNF